MTIKETNQILTMIQNVYPSFCSNRDPRFLAKLWHAIFENVPYELVKQALMEFIATDTRGFPPPPGALREIILRSAADEDMPGMEAWRLTRRAICRSMYHSREEFEKLPPLARRVIGSPDNLHSWAGMDDYQIQNNVGPWFLRAYDGCLERERRRRYLPSGGFLSTEGGCETGFLTGNH